MELSKQHLRGPVDELTVLSPEEWALVDAGHAREHPKAGGAFRFEVVAKPATTVWKNYRKRLGKKAASVIAAHQTDDTKAIAKFFVKDMDRTPAQRQAETQAGYDAMRDLLVSLTQVFGDGTRAEVAGDELAELFNAPAEGQAVAWCEAAAAGLEEELEPELLRPLEKTGESLADAVCRLVISTSGKAERQRAEIDEKEVAGPLSFRKDSGPGNESDRIKTASA